MRVLICGGGVIGASVAYFLSLRQVEAVVIEGVALALAASGKSGGLGGISCAVRARLTRRRSLGSIGTET